MGNVVSTGWSFIEALFYYSVCVLTLGTPWLFKIIIKKAIVEADRVM